MGRIAVTKLGILQVWGWQGHYERMRDSYRRLQGRGREDQFSLVDALTFFMFSHHMADWLVNDGGLSRGLVAHVTAADEMQLCRDICNGTKHAVLRDPSVPSGVYLASEYVPWSGGSSELVVLARGEKVRALDLASQCFVLWEKFVEEQIRSGRLKAIGGPL
jgi:hypothetical protein